jgi:hypothetical protein
VSNVYKAKKVPTDDSPTPGSSSEADAASVEPPLKAKRGSLPWSQLNSPDALNESPQPVPYDLDDLLFDMPAVHMTAFSPVTAGLAPREILPPCSEEAAEALSEGFRRHVMAVCVAAIASGWNTGQISYPARESIPFENEVFALAGGSGGFAPRQCIETAQAVRETIKLLHAAHGHLAGCPSPLASFCSEHRISQIGLAVLVFVAAPMLWGDVARAYAILSNDPGRPLCDQHLLGQLMGNLHRRAIARALDPGNSLVRLGIVRIAGGHRLFQGLEVDLSVVHLFSGSPLGGDVERGVALVPATVPIDRFLAPAALIHRAFADLKMAPPGRARLVLRGGNGSGRRTFLATLAELAGRTLATIDAAMFIREKRIRALAEVLQRAHLRGWLPCVDGLDTIGLEIDDLRFAVYEILGAHHGPLAVRLARHGHSPFDPGSHYVAIDLPVSTVAERAEQWSDISTEAGLVLDKCDELAARFAVGPGIIRKVVATVARVAPKDKVDHLVDSALRQHLETRLGGVATRVTRLADWSQIVLPSSIADSIDALVARVRHRRTVYDTWGFGQVMSSRGLSALFQGGPGTGKTLLAGALANELGLDLYRVDLSLVMSKWVGETEKNLGLLFDAAEQGQVMILFDEADALFAQRTAVRTSSDRYANIEVNYLLQRLDTFEGFIVLTTNLGTSIDPAFRRRLTCCLTLPLPDAEARERLWRIHIPKLLPTASALDLGNLARRYEMSGGYIRNAALRAAFLAAEEQTALSHFHLERAIRAEFRERGNPINSGLLE